MLTPVVTFHTIVPLLRITNYFQREMVREKVTTPRKCMMQNQFTRSNEPTTEVTTPEPRRGRMKCRGWVRLPADVSVDLSQGEEQAKHE